jgi:diguanylate cyclase (GGDEF)-like protein/PAS domain S-box-containing protein
MKQDHEGALSTAHLLIVDDDPVLRELAAKTLQHAGFEVSVAGDGEDALARMGTESFDLLLLDVMMPGLDGYEVCQRIRATLHGARLPILMLTGLNDTASIELAYRQGATDFITKPINWALLPHKVRYALRGSMAAEAMRRGRESLTRAQKLAGMGNWTVFADGRIETSAELLRLFGMTPDMTGTSSARAFLELVVPSDRRGVRRARARLARDGTPYQLEYRISRGDGSVRTMFEQAAPTVDELGRRLSVDGITQDITERVQVRERVQRLAHYDGTTGLPNRQFFAELAAPSLHRAARNRTGCGVLHLDIDRFKGVNDAFGRRQVDAVLKAVAERLRSWIRSSDLTSVGQWSSDCGTLASSGGNAFTLLITDLAGQEQSTVVAQRLLKAIGQPIVIESQSLILTASIGIAFFPNDASDLEGLTRCAEQALHAAKNAGRAQYRFFDEQMNTHAASRLRLESDLRRAVENNDLRLHFQPKVDASCGAIVGAEALVRWQHSVRGLIPPGVFIGLAEQTGVILPLTDWLLENACRLLREWQGAGLRPIPLSVNIAASSLTDGGLVGKLDALMQRFDLIPECLILEMTESILIRDIEAALVLLKTLQDRGYGLSLDDFGTGYSSMSYLKRLPVNELKIDRSFVTDLARGGRDGALAAAIIALGRELGLSVVAEGVETVEQSAFLLRRHCKVQQGYLFSRPVPAAEFARLLQSGFIFPPTSIEVEG